MENPTESGGDETIDLNDAVIEFLKRILQERGAQPECHYEIKQATAKGENYTGVLYRITAETEDESGLNKNIYCLLKVPPMNPVRRKQFFVRPSFLREAKAYAEFLPLAKKFQMRHGIESQKLRFHEYPECYGVMTDDFNEAIFLENMSFRGFKLFDRFKEIDLQHVALVMRAYGKLHAVSLALKDQAPTELKPFRSIVDTFEQRKDSEPLKNYFESLKAPAFKSLDPRSDKSYYKILKQYLDTESVFALLLACLKADDCEPYAVICHGDCWNNNYLFKYVHNTVTDVCVIDWQVMRYASPVIDLMYFLFANTTSEFRKTHYAEALDIYYEELSAHLKRLGLNAQKLFPRYALENQLKRKGAIGLLFAMLVLPIITLEPEDVPDLEKLSEQINSGETLDLNETGFLGSGNSSSFEKRMRGVIIDAIDYGYIPKHKKKL